NQGNTLTPSDRWNLLNHTVPTTVTAGSVFTPSLMLQNTSTWDWWEEAIVLGYQWTPPNASPLPGEWIEALWLPSLQMGDSITVAVPIEVSEQAGSYHLHIDLGKGIAPASARGVMEIDSSWFHEGGWPHAVIPVTVEGVAPTPTPSPTPTSTPTPTPTRTPTPTPQPTPTPGWRWWGTAEKAALKERPIEEQEAYSRLLSRIRDEVMAPDPKGEAYIRLVYWYAPEIAGLLLEDRALREEVAVLMDEARPLLEEMLEGEGGHTRLSESWVRRAQAVLDKVEGKASPELRGEIRWWRGWLPRFVGKTGWEIWRMLPEREVKLGVGRTPEEVVLRGLSAQEIWAYGQLLSRIRDEVMLRSPGERDGGLAGDG
ncbi:MAG: hypothetical protein H5U03_01635, partial [Clostridia bacterium]|nr:hypothetical protein [Clostridia bacterium]